jgi:uncharacterized membrane protein YeaQ/YmgE (transglycosylase-associated protein family)
MIDMHTQQDTSIMLVNLAIIAAVIFIAIYSFKKGNGGFLTLSQGLKIGTGTAALAGVMLIIYGMILANFLDPDFPSKVIDAQIAASPAAAEMSSEQLQMQKEQGLAFFWIGYPIQLIFMVIIGLIMGLIGGLIMKKSRPDY